jgi:hypothetical protein
LFAASRPNYQARLKVSFAFLRLFDANMSFVFVKLQRSGSTGKRESSDNFNQTPDAGSRLVMVEPVVRGMVRSGRHGTAIPTETYGNRAFTMTRRLSLRPVADGARYQD